jgi:hydroxypyruvate isomerase
MNENEIDFKGLGIINFLNWYQEESMMKISRKKAIKRMAGIGMLGMFGFPKAIGNNLDRYQGLNNRINHSVCRWCYGQKSLKELAEAASEIGIQSVELLNIDEWPVVQKYGLTCAMANGSPLMIPKGFNNPVYHDQLKKDYENIIPRAAEAGLKNVICFSGNREGLDDATGIEHCAKGLDPVVKMAEQYNITLCMELLNSKVDHADYQCDHTTWGVELVDKVGSSNFKLLYDIYHMQIMEGDIIATIRRYKDYIGHYHTGGVPGRNEIDETQELNYRAIMEAIVETGFTGFVAQEFIPTNDDVFSSLRQGIEICDA